MINIPIGNAMIDEYAFQDCSKLSAVYIPRTVTSIGHYVFDGCISLENIYYDGSKSQWDEAAELAREYGSDSKLSGTFEINILDEQIVKGLSDTEAAIMLVGINRKYFPKEYTLNNAKKCFREFLTSGKQNIKDNK